MRSGFFFFLHVILHVSSCLSPLTIKRDGETLDPKAFIALRAFASFFKKKREERINREVSDQVVVEN